MCLLFVSLPFMRNARGVHGPWQNISTADIVTKECDAPQNTGGDIPSAAAAAVTAAAS